MLKIWSKLQTIVFLAVLFLSAPAFAATFAGIVVDADTKEPIEGAVVVASWLEETATATGPSSRFKDVKEVLTDKDGKWTIQGPKGRRGGHITAIFTFLTGTYYTKPPEFIVFKPSYCSWPNGFGIDTCKGKIRPSGNDKIAEGETIEVPKLTNREDRLMSQRIWPSLMDSEGDKETLKRISNFIRLLNEEHRYLGLQEKYKEIENEK